MQPEHEDPSKEVRTIIQKDNSGKILITTVSSKPEDWTWNGIKEFGKNFKEGIAYLIRNAKGHIEVKKKLKTTLENKVLTDAVLKHVGIDPTKITPNLWTSLPPEVADAVKKIFAESCDNAKNQVVTSSEGKLCGTIFNRSGEIKSGGWTIRYGNVEFSSVAKEKPTGTDIAILLHVTDEYGAASIKTIWLQAKKDVSGKTPLSDLKDLKGQFDDMRKITSESFPLIITPRNVYVPEDLSGNAIHEFPDFMADTVRCKHGDQTREMYAESIDRKTIFEVAIKKGTPAPKSKKHKAPAVKKTAAKKVASKAAAAKKPSTNEAAAKKTAAKKTAATKTAEGKSVPKK